MSVAEDGARQERAGQDGTRLRATQTLVSHMSFCWRHPSVAAIEIAWRWLFGVPFLLALWAQAQGILAQIPIASTALGRLNFQNPWVSSVLLVDAAGTYEPPVAVVLRWIVPVAVVVWAVISGLGRMLVLWRMESLGSLESLESPESLRRPVAMRTLIDQMRLLPGIVALQAIWLVVLLGCFWLWYRGVAWAASTHITSSAEPDLVGYLCWLIFLSLGFFVLWAVLSWALAIAPVLLCLDSDLNAATALQRSFRLGTRFSGKLVEVNLVMAIVKIALIVLAMVFSAAPLPFSDQFGPDFMHLLYVVIAIAFFIADDYFQVVRLRSFVGLWRHYRDNNRPLPAVFETDRKIRKYSELHEEFAAQILELKVLLFVSDVSSLWDFTYETTLEAYYVRIREKYGVDVSDIEGALLWKIFQRIANHNRR